MCVDKQNDINKRLITTAVIEFGLHGLDGVSTRSLAKKANTVMSSITYYYGGKKKLYEAVANYVADALFMHLSKTISSEICISKLKPEAALSELCNVCLSVVQFMMHSDSVPLAQFVLREQMYPTDAFEVIYTRFIGVLAQRLTELIICATPIEISIDEARIKALALFGQCLIFRAAHATLLHLTQWERIEEEQVLLVKKIIRSHVIKMVLA